jgi:RNA polymerase sigma factor FliA
MASLPNLETQSEQENLVSAQGSSDVTELEEYRVMHRHAVISQVSLAPRPEMSPSESVDFYISGDFNYQLLVANNTSLWLERQLRKGKRSDDLDRVMSLLVKARAAICRQPLDDPLIAKTEASILTTLGVFIESKDIQLRAVAYQLYSPKGSLDKEDLYSLGQIGLLQGLERMDLSFDNEVMTFCLRRMMGAAGDEIRDFGSTIKIPRSVLQLAKGLRQDPDMLKALDVHERAWVHQEMGTLALLNSVASLDAPLTSDDEGGTGVELISDDTLQHIIDELEANEVASEVAMLVDRLPRRLAEIVRMYYGLSPYGEALTLQSIGAELGVTESRVSQLHTEAIKRLRKELRI